MKPFQDKKSCMIAFRLKPEELAVLERLVREARINGVWSASQLWREIVLHEIRKP